MKVQLESQWFFIFPNRQIFHRTFLPKKIESHGSAHITCFLFFVNKIKMASSISASALVANGTEKLKRYLEQSSNPRKDIVEFRKQHELGSPRCDALLELLGLMKLSRGEMYRGLLESLVKQLELAIPSMTPQQQEELLERTFPFITISDHLRVIPIQLLKRRQGIPSKYLNVFAQEESLRDVLEKLPLSVQQQVWESDLGFEIFEAHVSSFFESYRVNLGQRHLGSSTTTSFILKKK